MGNPMPAFKIKASVLGTKPSVDRTLAIPYGSTFEYLGSALDAAMGWERHEDHDFSSYRLEILPPDRVGISPKTLDERITLLSEHRDMQFTYDNGGDGRFRLKVRFLKDIPDYDGDRPKIVKFRGKAPANDDYDVAGYYRRHGQDSLAADWKGYLVEESQEAIDRANGFLARKWEPPAPPAGETLGERGIRAIAEAMADVRHDYCLDTEAGRVLPVGEGPRAVPEADVAAHSRYLPIEPMDGGLLRAITAHFAESMGVKLSEDDADACHDFADGLLGQDRMDYEDMLRMGCIHMAGRWLQENRVRYDAHIFAGMDLLGLGDAVKGTLDSLKERVSEKNDRLDLSDRVILCPNCAAECRPIMDKSLRPSEIGGVKRYPAVLRCPSCGKSTISMIENDGFNVDYAYEWFLHPVDEADRLIRLRIDSRNEKDPVARARILVDLATEYCRWGDIMRMIESLDKAGAGLGKYGWRRVPDLRPTNVALRVSVNDLKSVKSDFRDIKRTVGRIDGLTGTMLAAEYCYYSMNPADTRRMYDLARKRIDGCDRTDPLTYMAWNMACMGLYANGTDDDGRDAVGDLMINLERAADAVELLGFRSDITATFCRCLQSIIDLAIRSGEAEAGRSALSLAETRFCSDPDETHGGLRSIILYCKGVFQMLVEDDRDGAVESLSEVADIVIGLRENGRYSVVRGLYAIPLLAHLGAEGYGEAEALMAMRSLEALGGMTGIKRYLPFFLWATRGVVPERKLIEFLRSLEIALPQGDAERVAALYDPTCELMGPDGLLMI